MDRTLATQAPISYRASTPELLAVARSRGALDPSIFEEYPPFFWFAEISSTRIDSYFTQMQPSTLQNFAADAEAGVSFQNSHNVRSLGFGRSITGQYVGSNGNGVARCVADFYTIPGLKLNEVTTDDFIRGVRAGIISDVSVGFRGGEVRCSICGRDMLTDWDCNHIPGFRYDIRDTVGNTIRNEIAIGRIEDAHLAEVSAVFEGATPGASILKAQSEALNGRMSDIQIRLFEQHYRIRLPEHRIVVQGAAFVSSPEREPMPAIEHGGAERSIEGDPMPQEQEQPAGEPVETTPEAAAPEAAAPAVEPTEAPATEAPAAEEPAGEPAPDAERQALITQRDTLRIERDTFQADLTSVRAQLAEARAALGASEGESLAAAVKALQTRAAAAEQELASIRPAAEDGRTYRDDLIAEALAEGVRALGATFDKDTYEGVLRSAPLTTVKRMREDWRAQADRAFVPGRKTVDGPVEQPTEKPAASPPAAAFKA